MRSEHGVVTERIYPYYQEHLRSHSSVKATDSFTAISPGSVMEANLTCRDYHQNQVMKKVASSVRPSSRYRPDHQGFYGMHVPVPGIRKPGRRCVVDRFDGRNFDHAVRVLFRRRDWL